MHSDPDAPKPPKRSRNSEDEEANAYIPDMSNGVPHMTITFSLKDEKGALARILKPFDVCIDKAEGNWEGKGAWDGCVMDCIDFNE